MLVTPDRASAPDLNRTGEDLMPKIIRRRQSARIRPYVARRAALRTWEVR
ncbi:hypothetical protein GCM10023405_02930 [Streptomonospora salina]